MAIEERLRLNIHTEFSEILRPEEADAVMTHMMQVAWREVATKDDLRVLSAEVRAELHREVGGLRTELRTEIGGLHREIGGLRTDVQAEIGGLHREIGGLRTDVQAEIGGLHRGIGGLQTEIGGLRAEFHREIGGVRAEVHQAIVGQTTWLTGYVTALGVAMMTVARLIF